MCRTLNDFMLYRMPNIVNACQSNVMTRPGSVAIPNGRGGESRPGNVQCAANLQTPRPSALFAAGGLTGGYEALRSLASSAAIRASRAAISSSSRALVAR